MKLVRGSRGVHSERRWLGLVARRQHCPCAFFLVGLPFEDLSQLDKERRRERDSERERERVEWESMTRMNCPLRLLQGEERLASVVMSNDSYQDEAADLEGEDHAMF